MTGFLAEGHFAVELFRHFKKVKSVVTENLVPVSSEHTDYKEII